MALTKVCKRCNKEWPISKFARYGKGGALRNINQRPMRCPQTKEIRSPEQCTKTLGA